MNEAKDLDSSSPSAPQNDTQRNGNVPTQRMRGAQVTTPTDYSNFFPARRQTKLPGGYMGKVLRVDLSAGKFTDLNLPEEPFLRKYWGGQLFAEYVLLNELPTAIDPYDSKNVIVGMTGPVTGTGFTPGGTKICFVYL